MTMIGAALLWVGWFGFNAGSNLEATGGAGLAFINTILATAAAGMSWMLGRPAGRPFFCWVRHPPSPVNLRHATYLEPENSSGRSTYLTGSMPVERPPKCLW